MALFVLYQVQRRRKPRVCEEKLMFIFHGALLSANSYLHVSSILFQY